MNLIIRCKFATSYLRAFTFEIQELSDVVIGKDDVFIEASEDEVNKVRPAIYKLLSKDFDELLYKYLHASLIHYNADHDADDIINTTIDRIKDKYSIESKLVHQRVYLEANEELYFEISLNIDSRSEFMLDRDDLYEFKSLVLERMFKKLFINRAILHSGVISDDNGLELIVSFSAVVKFNDTITTAHLFAEQEVN